MLAAQCEGRQITTIESLSEEGTPHPVHGVGPDLGSIDDDTRNAAPHQAERTVKVARALKQVYAA